MSTTRSLAAMDAALSYAHRGFFVIPLCSPFGSTCTHDHRDTHKGKHKIGKTPVTVNGYNSATRDDAIIKSWWREFPTANVGMAVGPEHNLLCLEADMHKNEDGVIPENGLESLGALEDDYGKLPKTLTGMSGGGGEAFIFLYPQGVDIRSGKVLNHPGLEVKADGGIVVAPSRHVSGGRYEWIDESDPAPAPQWLIDLIATPGRLPDIIVNAQLRDVRQDALDALQDAEKTHRSLFVQGAKLMRIGRDEKAKPHVTLVGESELKNALTDAANFYRVSISDEQEKRTNVSPPVNAIQGILGLEPAKWPFPPLEGIVEIPTFRKDGSILAQPGYDACSRLYYLPHPNLKIPSIPEHPARSDVERARNFVHGFIGDFPYGSQADRANAWGALFTTITRHLVRHVPLALIDANKPGTGKGLLSNVITIIAKGTPAETLSPIAGDEEWDKRITALLLEGSSLIVIDNIESILKSAVLAKVLTADFHKGRLLGLSKSVTVPQRAIWLATGNNIMLGGDLPRRVYRIRMTTDVSDPEARENFVYPRLVEAVTAMRGEIVASLLTIARAWFDAGMPAPAKKLRKLGDFSDWVDLVGGILAFAGIDGFLENIDEMRHSAAIDETAWELFLEVWYTELGEAAYTTSELIAEWKGSKKLAETLPDPIVTWFQEDIKSLSRKVGKVLAKYADTPYGVENLRIIQGRDSHTRVATFRIGKRKVAGYAGYAGFDSPSQENFQGNVENKNNSNEAKQTPHTPHTPQDEMEEFTL